MSDATASVGQFANLQQRLRGNSMDNFDRRTQAIGGIAGALGDAYAKKQKREALKNHLVNDLGADPAEADRVLDSGDPNTFKEFYVRTADAKQSREAASLFGQPAGMNPTSGMPGLAVNAAAAGAMGAAPPSIPTTATAVPSRSEFYRNALARGMRPEVIEAALKGLPYNPGDDPTLQRDAAIAKMKQDAEDAQRLAQTKRFQATAGALRAPVPVRVPGLVDAPSLVTGSRPAGAEDILSRVPNVPADQFEPGAVDFAMGALPKQAKPLSELDLAEVEKRRAEAAKYRADAAGSAPTGPDQMIPEDVATAAEKIRGLPMGALKGKTFRAAELLNPRDTTLSDVLKELMIERAKREAADYESPDATRAISAKRKTIEAELGTLREATGDIAKWAQFAASPAAKIPDKVGADGKVVPAHAMTPDEARARIAELETQLVSPLAKAPPVTHDENAPGEEKTETAPDADDKPVPGPEPEATKAWAKSSGYTWDAKAGVYRKAQ